MARTRSIFAFNIQAGSLLLAVGALLWFRYYITLIGHGEIAWITIVLALAAIAVSVIGHRMRPTRVPRVTIGIVAAAGAIALVGLFSLRSVQHAFVHSQHAGDNSFGGGWSSDLSSDEYGPMLLADPAVTEHIRGWIKAKAPDWTRERDNLQLLYMSLVLQKHTFEQIENDSLGHGMICALLITEGWPLPWWPNATWPKNSFDLHPSGAFKMGLLPASEAMARVRRWAEDWTVLPSEDLEALIFAVGLHPTLLTREQADGLFDRWRALHPDDAWPLDAVADGRRRLADLAAAVAHEGQVKLAIELPSDETKEFAAAVDWMFRRLLGGVGFAVGEGKDLVVKIAIETREYRATQWHHMWTDRKYLIHQAHKSARKDVIKEEVVDINREETVVGTLRAPVLVMHIAAGGKEIVLEAPPMHFRHAAGTVPDSPPLMDGLNEASCEKYRLPSREAFLLGAWNWGLVQ